MQSCLFLSAFKFAKLIVPYGSVKDFSQNGLQALA